MKKILCLAAGLLTLNLTPVFGQQPPRTLPPVQQTSGDFQQRLHEIINGSNPPANQKPALTRFNLDFPGGTPAELVKAIEKATGKPLNVIIPTENADFKLPPLKLHEVTFRQVAETIGNSKTIWVRSNSGMRLPIQTGYQFTTPNNPPTDNSIWFFHVQQPPPKSPVQKVSRFYNLDPYLNRGFTVDDITTAIQTGWKMAGITSLPKLEYHKETKLLIAFGEPEQLKTIEEVLQTLPQDNNYPVLRMQVLQLQREVTNLKKKFSALNSTSHFSSEEKSGK